MRGIKLHICLLFLLVWVSAGFSQGKLKIYIIAGEENMIGSGTITPTSDHITKNGGMGTLDYMVQNDTNNTYSHLVTSGVNYKVLDDVWIYYNRYGNSEVKGDLTAGYGFHPSNIGPELQFGHAMGDFHNEQILIIKTAWVNQSLGVDFYPPSSGDPSGYSAIPTTDGDSGFYFMETVRMVRDVIANLGTHFPNYNGNGYEIAGFGWNHGWTDSNDAGKVAEYQTNMRNFILDMRDSLGVDSLPFVVGLCGLHGPYGSMVGQNYDTSVMGIWNAQFAMADYTQHPDFVCNVTTVDTRDFARPSANSPAVAEEYFWNNNAESFFLIGDAMAQGMQSLLQCDSTCSKTMQAEDASLVGGGATVETGNNGNFGTGIVNFPATGGHVEFIFEACTAGPSLLEYRYALASGQRTGNLTINAVVQPITTNSTGSWTSYVTESIVVNLRIGTNYVLIQSTGQDFGNLDQIKIVNATTPLLIIEDKVTDATDSITNDGAINVTVSGGYRPYSFSWSNGDSIEDIKNVPPGTYILTVTDKFGNAALDTFLVKDLNNHITDTSTIIIDTTITITGIDTGYITEVFIGDQLVMLGWTIILDNQDTIYVTSKHTDMNQSGTYLVILNLHTPDTHAVSDIFTIQYEVGIEEEIQKDISLVVYPNPIKEIFTIVYSSAEVGPVRVRLVDIRGIVIYDENVLKSNHQLLLPINKTPKSPGVYFITIDQGKTHLNTKFVKQ